LGSIRDFELLVSLLERVLCGLPPAQPPDLGLELLVFLLERLLHLDDFLPLGVKRKVLQAFFFLPPLQVFDLLVDLQLYAATLLFLFSVHFVHAVHIAKLADLERGEVAELFQQIDLIVFMVLVFFPALPKLPPNFQH
jgi:hypothetical protein